jgi:hypothetical protein
VFKGFVPEKCPQKKRGQKREEEIHRGDEIFFWFEKGKESILDCSYSMKKYISVFICIPFM